MSELKIKVCGMRDPENISGVCEAMPDFLGFIFYPESSRFVGNELTYKLTNRIPKSIVKVGVFVNELPLNVIHYCNRLDLDAVQLHGNELPEFCLKIKNSGLTVFKAFSVDESFDFSLLKNYSGVCDYFLFDTKGNLPGGTGHKFNWQLLNNYSGETPFFLSGGIGPDDIEAIRQFNHPQLIGIDINSGFEISPALKNIDKIKKFIDEIRK